MKLEDLRILSRKDPIGIGNKPYFSYVLQSENKNTYQVSRAIRVIADGRTVWYSEENTDQSIFIPYEGELQSRTRYDVTISATDNHGESDTISGYFETALLNSDDWTAKWISSTLPAFPAEKGFGKQPPATMFNRAFRYEKGVAKARLYVTCHGIYIPYLNGERIGNSEFAPGHSTYEKVLFYQTYDVTDSIVSGANEISFYVGDGWYLGAKTTPRVKNYERAHALLFQLEITDENGEIQTICSDDLAECSHGPIVSSDMFAGEKYDANLHFDKWSNAIIADYTLDNLRAQCGGEVTKAEEVQVKEILTTPEGKTVLDFGKVMAGRVRMKINAPKNIEIKLTHTEALNKDGSFFVSTEMPDGGVEQIDAYISNGTPAIYEPIFTYHGFRYVKVEGIDNIRKEDFTAVVYSSDGENRSSFSCSNEKLNILYRNIRNAQRSNMFSIPTDCPSREKAGWTGDIAIYAKTALHNSDITLLLKNWLLSVRADQGENGAVPIVVPYDGGYPFSEMFFGPMYEETGTIGSAGWGDACVLVPYAMYTVTGNKNVISENLDVMEKWCGYILKRCELSTQGRNIPKDIDRWLWSRGYHQGDWLVPSLERVPNDDPIMGPLRQMELTMQYAAPMYAYNTFRIMSTLLSELKLEDKAKEYSAVAQKMKEAIQIALFDTEGKIVTDLMGAYVLAVAFDLVPERHKEYVSNRLLTLIKENGGCLNTGFLSTPYLLDALCRIDKREEAYKLLYQEKCPSWLYEIEHGATSIWESWENYNSDGDPKKISYNHYALGCVDDWICRNICGIEALRPGYRTFRIAPKPDSSLEFAERSLRTEYGEIFLRWDLIDGKYKIKCKIPCNTSAEIVLPSGKAMSVGSGEYQFEE